MVVRSDDTREKRKGTGLGRPRCRVAPNRLRQPVAEIEVGYETLSAGDEEAVPAKPVLELSKGPVGLMELECQ